MRARHGVLRAPSTDDHFPRSPIELSADISRCDDLISTHQHVPHVHSDGYVAPWDRHCAEWLAQLESLGFGEQAKRVTSCTDHVEVEDDPDDPIPLGHGQSCNARYCPRCAWGRSIREARTLKQWVLDARAAGYRPCFVTLEAVYQNSLREAVRLFREDLERVHRSRRSKGLRVRGQIEGIPHGDGWRVHCHLLVYCEHLSKDTIREILMGIWTQGTVDVRPIGDPWRRARYCTKGQPLIGRPNEEPEWMRWSDEQLTQWITLSGRTVRPKLRIAWGR